MIDNPHTQEILHILANNLMTRLTAVGFTCAVERLPHQIQYRAVLTDQAGHEFTATNWSPLSALEQAYTRSLSTSQKESASE